MPRTPYRIVDRSGITQAAATVLIPTWNNIACLQTVLRSLETHAILPLHIVVIVNEGADGSLAWLHDHTAYDYVHAEQNLGVCYALNLARSLVRSPYVLYLNDDMYVLPGWDTALINAANAIGHPWFFLSATMIEPGTSGNNCVIRADYGRDPASLQEERLLREFRNHPFDDWQGSTWPPNLLHRDVWDMVGGLSVEFSPGMYSDPDLSRKLWHAGVRHFQGIADSRVYHFGAKSTRRVKHNPGSDLFLKKWGITSSTFTRFYLRRGERFVGPCADPVIPFWVSLKNRLKRFF